MNAIIEILNAAGLRAADFAWPVFWQSSLLIAGLFALDRLCRRKLRAAVRYALWLVVLAKLLMPPSLAFPTGLGWWLRSAPPQSVAKPASVVISYSAEALPPIPVEPESAWPAPAPPSLSTPALFLVGSCFMSLGLLGWMLARWRAVVREVQEASPATPELEALLAQAGALAGWHRAAPLQLVDKPLSPAVCGLVKPTILLPRSLVDQLTPEQLRVVLVHELVHLRRSDVWVNFLQALLQIVYWWHPLLWLANARLRQLREEAVDDAVMQALAGDAETYAPTLLGVARLALQRPLASLGLVGILESRSSLHQRIKRLVDFHPPRNAGLTAGAAFAVLAFAAIALPMGEQPATTSNTFDPPPATRGDGPQFVESTNLFRDTSPDTLPRIKTLYAESQAEYEECLRRQPLLDKVTTLPPEDMGKAVREARIHDTILEALSEQLSIANTNLALLRSKYPPSHPSVLEAATQLEDLKKRIQERVSGIRLGNIVKTESLRLGLAQLREEVLKVFRVELEPGTNHALVPRAAATAATTLVQDGKLLFEMGKLGEAEAKLKEAILRDPQSQAAYYYLDLVRQARTRKSGNQAPAAADQSRVRTNWIATSKGRQAILAKLNSIRLESFGSQGLPLDVVMKNLSDEARRRDPEQRGINFVLNPNQDASASLPKADPATGLAILPSDSDKTPDLRGVLIRIDPPLMDIRLADALDAVVKVAGSPIKYSIEDYAIVFSHRSTDAPRLYTRMFKVDPNTFLSGLRSAAGLAVTEKLDSRRLQETLRGFFTRAGVELNPPKSVFFNDREGSLLVRASLEDLDKIEPAVAALNQPPPQISIQTKFIEIPEAALTNFWASCNIAPARPTNQARLLTPPQAAAVLRAVKENPMYRLAHEASVTTLSDRQVQIQVVDMMTVVTNINPAALQAPGIHSTNGSVYLTAEIPVGPTLDLVPHLIPGRTAVQLTTIPTLVQFLGYDKTTNTVTYYVDGKRQRGTPPLPRFNVASLTNSATVGDGDTLVLDGLVSENISKLKDKVPVLGDVPLVGRLFRSESTLLEKRRMLVLITPTLVDPTGNRIYPTE